MIQPAGRAPAHIFRQLSRPTPHPAPTHAPAHARTHARARTRLAGQSHRPGQDLAARKGHKGPPPAPILLSTTYPRPPRGPFPPPLMVERLARGLLRPLPVQPQTEFLPASPASPSLPPLQTSNRNWRRPLPGPWGRRGGMGLPLPRSSPRPGVPPRGPLWAPASSGRRPPCGDRARQFELFLPYTHKDCSRPIN